MQITAWPLKESWSKSGDLWNSSFIPLVVVQSKCTGKQQSMDVLINFHL